MKLRIKERMRLARMQERKKDLNVFANSMYSALYTKGFTDIDRVNILKTMNNNLKEDIHRRKQLKEQDFLLTEKANDNLKFLTIIN